MDEHNEIYSVVLEKYLGEVYALPEGTEKLSVDSTIDSFLKEPSVPDVLVKIFIPFLLVIVSACRKGKKMFKKTLELLDEFLLFKGGPRLELNQTYEVLATLDFENAQRLFDMLECDDKMYSDLCDALRNKEMEKLMDLLGKNNTRKISCYLRAYYFPIWSHQIIVNSIDDDNLKEDEIFAMVMDYLMIGMPSKNQIEDFQLEDFASGMSFSKTWIDNGMEDELWRCVYDFLTMYYWELVEGQVLTEEVQSELKALLCQSGYEENFSTVCTACRNGQFLEYMFSEYPDIKSYFPSEELGTVPPQLDGSENKCEYSPYEDIGISSTRGRKKASWFIPHPNITEEKIGALIERDIWPKVAEWLDKFKYPSSCKAGKTRKKVIKALGATMIYYASQEVEIAYPNDYQSSAGPNKKHKEEPNKQSGSLSSFERTMSFLKDIDGKTGFSRSSMKPYLEMLLVYEYILPAFSNRRKTFAEYSERYKRKDSIRGYILQNNMKQLQTVLLALKEKMRKLYDKAKVN